MLFQGSTRDSSASKVMYYQARRPELISYNPHGRRKIDSDSCLITSACHESYATPQNISVPPHPPQTERESIQFGKNTLFKSFKHF